MIVRWNARLHYKALASWYHARELEAPLPHRLPEVGFVVDNRVAGFLYRTDSSVALIDGLISNPHTIPSVRKLSMEKLCGLLVDTAISLGYEDVMFTSSHPGVQELGKRLGFKRTEQTLYVLDEPADDFEPDFEAN